MNIDRVQEITEALGSRLRRGVAVDDRTLRLLAVGKDYGDADPARIWSLLHRRTRPEDVDYAELRRLEGPSRVPAVAELGLSGRLVVPIRHRGVLLGFLWIIDHDDEMTPRDREDAAQTAEALATMLHQRLTEQDRDRALASHLFEVLLLGSTRAEQAGAAVELLTHGLIEDDSHVGVLVLRREHDPDADPSVLRTAVQNVCRRLPPGTWLSSVQRLQATVLIAARRPVADTLAATAASALRALAGAWRAGTGAPTQGLTSAPAARRQAVIACTVTEALGRPAGVVGFDDLGPYALLGQLPVDVVANDLLPIGLFNLLHLGAHELLDTVEAFLDHAGDKQRTAQALGVHRSTLYHRLERIESISGLDLADGGDRLLAHLAVKLHRLSLARPRSRVPVDEPGRDPSGTPCVAPVDRPTRHRAG